MALDESDLKKIGEMIKEGVSGINLSDLKFKAEAEDGSIKEFSFDTYVRGLQHLAKKSDELGKKVEGFEKKEPEPKKPEKSSEDLEDLTREDFGKHILGQVGELVTKALEPITEQLGGLDKSVKRGSLREEIKEASDKYKDFDKFAPLIRREMEGNKSLSIDDAYLLAKAKNPDEVKKIEDEIAAEAKERGEVEEERPLGLLPTSGSTSPKEDMDDAEAFDAAWEDTIANTPAETALRAS